MSLRSKTFKTIKPGQKISASDWNRLTDIAERLSPGVQSGGGGTSYSDSTGQHFYEDRKPWFLAKIVGSGANNGTKYWYEWEQVHFSMIGQVLEPGADGLHGYKELEKYPAYELNGNSTVPADTVVRMWFGAGPWMEFEYQPPGGLTVRELDGTPSTTGVEIINIDQDQNLTCDETSSNEVTIGWEGVDVELNDSYVGTERILNFLEGTNIDLTVADDSGNGEIDITVATVDSPTFVTITATTLNLTTLNVTSLYIGGTLIQPLRVKEADNDPNVYPVYTLVADQDTYLRVTDDTAGQVTLWWEGVCVRHNDSDVGVQICLNFIDTTYITFTVTEDGANDEIEISAQWTGVKVKENTVDKGTRRILHFLDTDYIFFNVTDDAVDAELEIEAEWAGVEVRKAGTLIGTRPTINFHEGTGISLTVADDAGNAEVDVTVASTVTTGGYPTFSGCIATKTNQNITDSTETDILYDTEIEDTDTYHSTVTNTQRFVVPATGRYFIRAQVAWAANATGYRQATIYHSTLGAIATDQVQNTGSGDSVAHSVSSRSPSVSVSSYFYLAVEQTSGGDLQMTHSRFEIHRIS